MKKFNGIVAKIYSERISGKAKLLALGMAISSPFAYAQGVDLPDGFSETVVATNIQNPVGMEISPDGRVFVLAGNVRRIEVYDDNGYVNEFIRLPQALNSGSGLLGFEFAPDFETTGQVYIAYITDPDDIPGPQQFRLSRFNSNGTVANLNSEQILFEVEDVDPNQQQHQGGDLVIGADNKIYWALGDRVEGSVVSQPLDSLFGKLLRLNLDGSIPADNPFFGQLSGDFRAIYSNGLRNPYRMDKSLRTGEIIMSEVGPQDWEELNRAEAGANYGWPIVSGVVNNPSYTDPVHAYNHTPDGCAVTGGAFYEPNVNQFPAIYHDKFFYGDHCFGWIAYVDFNTGEDVRFLADAHRLVEVKISPVTGAMYYLDREYAGDTDSRSGGVGRIDFVGGEIPLSISRQPASVEAAVGEDVSFEVSVTGESPFDFQWYENNSILAGETDSALTVSNVKAGDNGDEFFVIVEDANGATEESNAATLTVTANNAPEAVIVEPFNELRYIAGEEYKFLGFAEDAEDGVLDRFAYNWEIVFHHDDHTHPFIPEFLRQKRGTFVPPTNDETEPNVFYRIHLTVTDSSGTSTTVQKDVLPLISEVNVQTQPAGLELLLDGTPQNGSITFDGVAGVARVLEAPATQSVGGQTWSFVSWSNGGDRVQTISTPEVDTTYTAVYQVENGSLPVAGLISPTNNSVVGRPLTIGGVASDDSGIKRVQLAIRDLSTSNHWDGSNFVPGWRTVDAQLDNPDDTVTAWSYELAPDQDVDLRISVNARQIDGTSGNSERVDVTLTGDAIPFLEITSPENHDVVTDPVSIIGEVEPVGLSSLKLVIKALGEQSYWNGTDWQNERIELDADSLSGRNWSYLLNQPNNNIIDVVVVALARYQNVNSRLRTGRLEIHFENAHDHDHDHAN